ncbi:MAG TPA: hypothetical protein VGE74_18880 [Gemmata sp.]
MTEAEWFACGDPALVIGAIGRPAWTERRGRLFAVECCNRLRALPDPRLRAVIETVERYADGLVAGTELSAASTIAVSSVEWEARHDMSSWQSSAAEVVLAAVSVEEYTVINSLVASVLAGRAQNDEPVTEAQQRRALVALMREIAWNPFRPVAFNSAWRTADVVALAEGTYEKAFDRLPIFADALQDAGCGADDLLMHLRDPEAAHVRGCWALDLVLGKG